MVPLWEYTSEEGKIVFTHPVDNPLPVKAYLSIMGKYGHLDEDQIAHIQKTTDERIEVLKRFAAAG